MKDFKRAFTAMTNGGNLAFGEEMINVLFIGGDEEIKTNDDYFLPARKEMKDFLILTKLKFSPRAIIQLLQSVISNVK